MISFIEYLCEGATNPDKAKLRQLFYSVLKNTSINAKKSERAVNEIFRADLGKTEEQARSFLQPLCDKIGIKLGDYSIFGRPTASGTYQSFEFEYNGKKYYITNTETGKGLLHNKDLVPNKILTNIADKFDSFDKLVNNINWNKVKHEQIKNVMHNLINSIDEFNVVESSGFFNNDDFNSILSNKTSPLKGKLVIQNSVELIESLKTIDNADVLNISKDFGEILQPGIFLKKYNSIVVSFPVSPNEKLVDYYINGISFSAKSSSGGAPSGADLFVKAMNDMAKFKNKYNPKEIKFIKDFNDIYSKNIFQAQQIMIQKFLIDEYHDLNMLYDIGFDSWNTYSDLAKSLDNITDKTTFFTQLYDLLHYHPENFKTGTTPYDVKTIVKNWDKYNDKLKWGILFYPLYIASIKVINQKYQTLLTSIISKTMNMIQCYFDIKSNVMILKLYEAQANNWKFTSGGISTANIGNAKLSIKMLKS